jgi:hypothetical protein
MSLIVLALAANALLAQPNADAAVIDPTTTKNAQEMFAAGIQAFTAKDYDKAITHFQDAYRMSSRADILYAWAQAERLRGNCRGAMPLYELFVGLAVRQIEATRAREHLMRCRELLPSPWYRDWLGHGLGMSGAVGMTLGIYLFRGSTQTLDRADQAATYADYSRRVDSGRNERRNAIIGLGVGSVLLAAAAGHYIWFVRHGESPRVTAAIAPEQGAVLAGVTW